MLVTTTPFGQECVRLHVVTASGQVLRTSQELAWFLQTNYSSSVDTESFLRNFVFDAPASVSLEEARTLAQSIIYEEKSGSTEQVDNSKLTSSL